MDLGAGDQAGVPVTDDIQKNPETQAEPRPKGIRVRVFEERDIPDVRAMIRLQHSETLFHNQPLSDEKLDRQFEKVLKRPPGMIALVADWQGKVIGGTWAVADTYMLSDGPPFVTVHGIQVDLTQKPLRRAKAFLAIGGRTQEIGRYTECEPYIHPCHDRNEHELYGSVNEGGSWADSWRNTSALKNLPHKRPR